MVNAQWVGFTQYYNAPLVLNPAMTSLQKDMYVAANYKSRMNGEIPFETQQVAGIYPIIKRGAQVSHLGGVGLSVMRDNAGSADFGGELNRLSANVSFSYNQKLDRYGAHYATAGLQLGFVQTAIGNINNEIWRSQILWDGTNFMELRPTGVREQQAMFVANAGFFYIYNSKNSRFRSQKNIKIYAGGAFQNINRPNQSFTFDQRFPAPLVTRFHGGTDVDLTTKIEMSLGALYANYSGINQINAGANFSYKTLYKSTSRATTNLIKFTVGGWYRVGDMYTALIGGSFANVNVMFSADINGSPEDYLGSGQQAYELSISYNIVRARRNQKFSSPLF